jgi:homocysteine S-methyltransferase
VAASVGAGLLLESPTWRASAEWGQRLGYGPADLDRINRMAIDQLHALAAAVNLDRVQISGVIGPRGDGYIAAGSDPDEAVDYHAPQVTSLAAAGADFVHAMTLSEPAEAIGVVRAARGAGVRVAISFTVETDGRLPDGTPLRTAVEQVDEVAAPDWFGLNCAHPTHVRPALDGSAWQARIRSFRPNASSRTHEELDAMVELDTGDRELLASATVDLLTSFPELTILGGCCGTDAAHVGAMWALVSRS